ncbi:hypothetical protein PR048_019129 [Dryococelus australis]|uniref:Uncharacterized protein n=1 Tax=Dryococelus australis TaxID=614101 RepID=A0ABQ9H2M2_9NEOP|nr:hypothetical protein PR048_019129 [Dryococelus australis]
MWGAIYYEPRNPLAVIEGTPTTREYAQEDRRPWLVQLNNLILQHCNARPRTARPSLAWLRDFCFLDRYAPQTSRLSRSCRSVESNCCFCYVSACEKYHLFSDSRKGIPRERTSIKSVRDQIGSPLRPVTITADSKNQFGRTSDICMPPFLTVLPPVPVLQMCFNAISSASSKCSSLEMRAWRDAIIRGRKTVQLLGSTLVTGSCGVRSLCAALGKHQLALKHFTACRWRQRNRNIRSGIEFRTTMVQPALSRPRHSHTHEPRTLRAPHWCKYYFVQDILRSSLIIGHWTKFWEPIRVIEVSMEQHRNERAVETGDSGESPPTDGIVRHDSHMRKSGVTRPGIEPASVEQANRSATVAQALLKLYSRVIPPCKAPRVQCTAFVLTLLKWSPREVSAPGSLLLLSEFEPGQIQICILPDVVNDAASVTDMWVFSDGYTARLPPRGTAFNSRPGHSGFLQVVIVPEDAAGWRFFSGNSRFSRPCIPALLHSHLISPSLAPKTSLLRAVQVPSLTKRSRKLYEPDSQEKAFLISGNACFISELVLKYSVRCRPERCETSCECRDDGMRSGARSRSTPIKPTVQVGWESNPGARAIITSPRL